MRQSILLFYCSLLLCSGTVSAQVHQFSWPTDGGLLGLGAFSYGLSIPLKKSVPPIAEDDRLLLDHLRIRPLDRLAIGQSSEGARRASDVLLRGALLMPLGLLADEGSRQEFGLVGLMWLETLLLTNGITDLTKSRAQRSRPYTYNPFTGEELLLDTEARLSFFSGHASNTAAMSFFTAQTLVHNRPDMRGKGLVWASAATVPAVVGLLRVKAGKHFPTDVIVGYAVGAVIGWAVPKLHR